MSLNANLKQMITGDSRKQQPVRSQSNRLSAAKSPSRQRVVYGQCQAPSSELYKPVLRASAGATPSGKGTPYRQDHQPKLTSSVNRVPIKTDFVLSGRQESSGTAANAAKPSFVSPSPTTAAAAALGRRCDSRASVRRNLDQ